MNDFYSLVMVLCEWFAVGAAGLFAGFLVLTAVRTVAAFCRRLEQKGQVLAGAAGDFAGVAAAWPFEWTIDQADKWAAEAAEWRTLRAYNFSTIHLPLRTASRRLQPSSSRAFSCPGKSTITTSPALRNTAMRRCSAASAGR